MIVESILQLSKLIKEKGFHLKIYLKIKHNRELKNKKNS